MAQAGKLTAQDIVDLKKVRKIVAITAYDYPTALLAERAGVDLILVGDSAGMVVLGYEDTIPVTMDEMLILCRAVSRGAKRPLLVGDMPFLSFQVSKEEAVRNAGRLVKEGGMDAVKIEGGTESVETAMAIIRAGIPVMGHVGLTPQSAILWTGYKLRGKKAEAAKRIVEDAKALDRAGIFSLVLEMVPSELAEIITREVSVPTIGIGAGPHCDGQILVLHDVLGLFERFTPKFAKRYANLSGEIQKALEAYRDEVLKGCFPGDEHSFHMEAEEVRRLLAELGLAQG